MTRSLDIRQRGTVLVIALIMLLLLTIIGIGGMRGTLLEERMAANTKEQHRALHTAELALARAEADLEDVYTGASSSPLQDLELAADCVGANFTTRAGVDAARDDLDWEALDGNPVNTGEVLPFFYYTYCGDSNPTLADRGARIRTYRNAQGLNLCGDAAVSGCNELYVHAFNAVGVGRVQIPDLGPDDDELVLSESVVVSAYAVISSQAVSPW